jgi:hypothetical protein
VAGPLPEAHDALAPLVTADLLAEVADLVPDAWLVGDDDHPSPEAARRAYVETLLARVGAPQSWLDAVEVLRAARV